MTSKLLPYVFAVVLQTAGTENPSQASSPASLDTAPPERPLPATIESSAVATSTESVAPRPGYDDGESLASVLRVLQFLVFTFAVVPWLVAIAVLVRLIQGVEDEAGQVAT